MSRQIATSVIRNNTLHEYDESYEYVEAYIHLSKGHKYMIERQDSYQEYDHMLTLAIHSGETDGYLILVYEDATIVKVPMSRILDKEVNKEYSRYNGANVVFACPARNDDVLYQAYEYRGETYHRLQDVSTLDELNIGDPGDLLFDVAFDKLLKTDIIPSEMKESLPKRITDRKRLGFTQAKKEGQKSYEILQKLGLS